MNKKLLCVALLAGLGFAQAAAAQNFDDRWYITGSTGFNIQDSARNTNNAAIVGLGFGKFVSEKWSLDAEFNHQNPRLTADQDLNWSQYGVSLDLRRHFITEGRDWSPYALVGLGYQRSEEEFNASPNPNSPGEREEGNVAAKVGLGVQADLDNWGARVELAYRIDNDDRSIAGSDESWFGDVLASVGIIIPLGEVASEEPPPPAPAAPPSAPNCADLDDDGDGVNNCNDRCPNSQAGEAIGPDGCKVSIAIDLKGVNFDFDKATLRPDAVAILNEAVEILKRYPDMRVEVAGHTDQCGDDGYNQSLSQRRADAVHNYLTSNGISGSRLQGPNGYGESRPLTQTEQTTPGCRNETNRRTELNVQ